MAMLFDRGPLPQDDGRIAERWGQDGSTLTNGSGNTGTTALTVTAGKSFFCKSITWKGGAAGDSISIRDGTTVKINLNCGVANTEYVLHLDAPLQFDTNVNGVAGVGTVYYNVVGWEE